jgi:hypothetical protein
MAALTEAQRVALANLGRKKAGEEVDWVNIAAARALTDLGLAQRDHAGWTITEAGEIALREQPPGSGQAPPDTTVEPFARG